MLREMFQALLRGNRRRKSKPAKGQTIRFNPGVLSLEQREVPAVIASFTPAAGGILTVFGDNLDNTITVSRNAAGSILVNGGAVSIVGGTPSVANTALIQVFGQGGNDSISLVETNGALPRANLFGGNGNDVLTGGSGGDMLFGQAGNDTLLGNGGFDFLFGGADNDALTGGDADDQVFGESGNDRMIWNPGDDTDLNEGGAGIDTVEMNGGNGAEQFTATANGTRVRFDRVNPAPFSIDIGTSESLVVNMNGGDDTFTAGNGLATLIQLTVDGGTGNDAITGGDGNDMLRGGDGNDTINGGRGTDTALMGTGDDTFVWNPGDGSDMVEGQDGNDRMVFNGANISEQFELSANGSRARFTRNIGSVTMDLNGVERVDVTALGGADLITVGDMSGTNVSQVNVDLSAGAAPGTGDGLADTVVVNGTKGNDNIRLFGSGTSAQVTGLPAIVNITGTDGASDSLTVYGRGGDDGLDAGTMPTEIVKLTLDGGAGNDRIIGSQGVDTLNGGDGNDFIDGNQGNDLVLMGAGDDVFEWNTGDGSDTVEGQGGNDRMLFFGSDQGEKFDFSANGSRVRFIRDVGTIVMDLNGVENVELRTLRGSDSVVVGDLSGTDLTHVELGLRAGDGGPDGLPDTITVNGSQAVDNIRVGGDTGGLQITSNATTITVFDQDTTMDSLTINGLGGNDTINAQSLRADSIRMIINGGDGDDTIVGHAGSDLINGGRGNDTVLMGAGDDTFVWNPGDGSDSVEGQDGTDGMVFNGANINEKFDISANGSRVRFTRDIATITMDLNGVENLDLNALAGADSVTVNDLSGTNLTNLQINLGAADGAADTVTVFGTNGDDVLQIVGDATGVSVLGFATLVNITGAEAANDRLTINALAGDDVVETSGLAAATIQFTADGGEGNDLLIGSDGIDTLLGGAGDDVLIGGLGNDLLDGGTGDNILIQ